MVVLGQCLGTQRHYIPHDLVLKEPTCDIWPPPGSTTLSCFTSNGGNYTMPPYKARGEKMQLAFFAFFAFFAFRKIAFFAFFALKCNLKILDEAFTRGNEVLKGWTVKKVYFSKNYFSEKSIFLDQHRMNCHKNALKWAEWPPAPCYKRFQSKILGFQRNFVSTCTFLHFFALFFFAFFAFFCIAFFNLPSCIFSPPLVKTSKPDLKYLDTSLTVAALEMRGMSTQIFGLKNGPSGGLRKIQ